MEEYVNVPTHIDDIYDIAKMFINDYQLGNELIIDKRYLTNKLEDKFDAISSGKKSIVLTRLAIMIGIIFIEKLI